MRRVNIRIVDDADVAVIDERSVILKHCLRVGLKVFQVYRVTWEVPKKLWKRVEKREV
jgi:hypothetical protein